MATTVRAPNLRLNVIANLAGKTWMALMSFAFVPLYIRFMGIEGYGLIGVFTMLITVFALLDFGFGMTVNRELARLGAIPGSGAEARTLLRTLEMIYWIIGALIGLTLALGAPLIADRWLNASHLPRGEVVTAIRMMGAIALFRWPVTLYSNALLGLGRQVVSNAITSLYATVAGGGAVLLLAFVSPSPRAFFAWQALAALGQVTTIRLAAWCCIPSGDAPRVSIAILRQSFAFSVGVSGISILAIIITQVDKVLLTRLLPLAQFGAYALAGSLAGLLYIAGASLESVMFPALTRMVTTGDHEGERRLYHLATRALAILVMPAACALIFFAPELVLAYLGDPKIAALVTPVIRLLAAGNGILAIMCLPYALQLAHGWVRLSIYKNMLATVVYMPMLFILVRQFGTVGAASAWVALTLSYLLIEVPMMHRRLLPDSLWRWYGQDIALPALICIIVFTGFRLGANAIGGLWVAVGGACAAAMFSMAVLSLTTAAIRARIATALPFLQRY
jgi:O-antigen/teichoic acid export membrane protein